MAEVRWVNDRVVAVVFENDDLWLIYVHALQSGRSSMTLDYDDQYQDVDTKYCHQCYHLTDLMT